MFRSRIFSSAAVSFTCISALSVLNDGNYPFIPLVCDSKAPFVSRLTKKDGNDLITRILRMRTLTEDVPACCHSITVRDCAIVCEEKGLFSVSFTLTVSPQSC